MGQTPFENLQEIMKGGTREAVLRLVSPEEYLTFIFTKQAVAHYGNNISEKLKDSNLMKRAEEMINQGRYEKHILEFRDSLHRTKELEFYLRLQNKGEFGGTLGSFKPKLIVNDATGYFRRRGASEYNPQLLQRTLLSGDTLSLEGEIMTNFDEVYAGGKWSETQSKYESSGDLIEIMNSNTKVDSSTMHRIISEYNYKLVGHANLMQVFIPYFAAANPHLFNPHPI